MTHSLERLRHHVSGAIARGEAQPIIGIPALDDSLKAAIERAADMMESGNWRAVFNGTPSLVGATDCYATRAYIREAMAPGEYRADGLRTNQTADEMIANMTPAQAARALRGLLNGAHVAYHAARAADRAYNDELTRVYGREACNARYDERGEATPELRALARAKIAADEARRLAMGAA